jgi:hypothetical protein
MSAAPFWKLRPETSKRRVNRLTDPNGDYTFPYSFRHVVEHLIGQTIRVQTDDAAFSGKLAEVKSSFLTLATAPCTHQTTLIYIPVRHVNALTDL